MRSGNFFGLTLWIGLLMFANVLSQTKVVYKQSDELFTNPERGLYSELTSQAEQSPLKLSTLTNLRADGQSLILRMYYLKTFRYRPLSEIELNLVRNDLNVVRQAGMKCILRFAYSEDIGQPDAPLNIVMGHIAQLAPIIRENSDIIAAMQAGFVGAWGEWHSSTNGLDSVSNMKTILMAVLDALPIDRMVQVRTPRYVREIFGRTAPISRSEAFNGSPYSRVGFHDDCFLANWNDYGTYQDTTEEENYLSAECEYVPMGGETCNPSPYGDCANTVRQMSRLHWSFLNSGYNQSVINGWIKNGCFGEIAKRLGYRFQLVDGIYSDSSKPGGSFKFDIRIFNDGFAALFNPRDVELVIENRATNLKYSVKLPDDPRFWQPGDTVHLAGIAGLPEDMPDGNYRVYLNLPDSSPRIHFRPDYSVRFANEDTWQPGTGFNDLNFSVVVRRNHGGKMYTGLYYFQPLEIPEETKPVEHKDVK